MYHCGERVAGAVTVGDFVRLIVAAKLHQSFDRSLALEHLVFTVSNKFDHGGVTLYSICSTWAVFTAALFVVEKAKRRIGALPRRGNKFGFHLSTITTPVRVEHDTRSGVVGQRGQIRGCKFDNTVVRASAASSAASPAASSAAASSAAAAAFAAPHVQKYCKHETDNDDEEQWPGIIVLNFAFGLIHCRGCWFFI